MTSTALDPLAPTYAGEYRHGQLRVVRRNQLSKARRTDDAAGCGPHFRLRRAGTQLEVIHSLRPDQLDNDVARLIAAELFETGYLTGNELFEQIFTGVVRSTVRDPMLAWNTFYANTLAKIRECWTGSGSPGSQIADMAPVYDRALRLVPPGRVLDLGSCFGFFPLLLAERAQNSVIASDLVRGSMRLLSAVARHRHVPLRTLTCDAAAVPLPDGCVDTVTVLHLLEHLDAGRGKAVLSEAVRLARNWVVVAVPFEDEPAAVYGHVRRFDAAVLTQLGISTGRPFTVSEHHGGWLVVDAA